MKELKQEYGRFVWPGHGNVILDRVDRVGYRGRLWWWESEAPDKCFALEPKFKIGDIVQVINSSLYEYQRYGRIMDILSLTSINDYRVDFGLQKFTMRETSLVLVS